MDLAIEPIDRPPVSATDQVFDALYDAVISVNLPPGSKVSEAEIARQLGVSRQPVRDAFFRLSNLGFLAIRPQRATLITRISLDAVYAAVFTRTALEVECLRTAMARAPEVLAGALAENLDRQKDVVETDRGDFHALDDAFHGIICDAAGQAHVWPLIKDQKAHLDRIRYLTLSKERRHSVLEEHRSIQAAVLAGDTARAEDMLRQHLGGATATAEKMREAYPDYFDET